MDTQFEHCFFYLAKATDRQEMKINDWHFGLLLCVCLLMSVHLFFSFILFFCAQYHNVVYGMLYVYIWLYLWYYDDSIFCRLQLIIQLSKGTMGHLKWNYSHFERLIWRLPIYGLLLMILVNIFFFTIFRSNWNF